MEKQRGLSLMGMIVGLGLVAFFGVLAAKLIPAYVEYWSVRKIFAAMEKNGELNAPPGEIRRAYERRNAIEDVRNVLGRDLEISKQGGDTVVSAEWSVKVPMIGNVSACIDFAASTGGASATSDATQ